MSTIFDNDIAVLNYAENRRPREDPESLLPSVLPDVPTSQPSSRLRRASSAASSSSADPSSVVRQNPYRSTLTDADDSPGSPGPAKADSSVSGRGRSASLLDQIGNSLGLGGGAGADESHRAFRSGTVTSTEDAFGQTVLSRLTYVRHWTHQFSRVNLRLYFQRISKRAVFYLGSFIILSLCVMSKSTSDNMLWGVPVGELYSFLIIFCIVDMGTTTIDHMVFFAIDNWWKGHFNVAYILHAFKGPFGLSLLIIIVSNGMEEMGVARAMSNFNTIISGLIAVLICYSIKNYIQHVKYTEILEERFRDRLEQIEIHRSLFSILASNRALKDSEVATSSLGQSGSSRLSSGVRSPRPSSSSSSSSSQQQHQPAPPNGLESLALAHAPSLETFTPFAEHHAKVQEISKNILQRDGSNNGSSNNVALQAHGEVKTDDVPEFLIPFAKFAGLDARRVRDVFQELVEEDEAVEDAESTVETSKKVMFWKRMQTLNEGILRIATYNGTVHIKKRKQAKLFGEKLYLHLSRSGKQKVTATAIRKLVSTNISVFIEHEILAGNIVSGSTEEAVKSALKELDSLFHMPPGDEECVVSEADIVAGVIQVFKQMKFAASSLYDFGELQATLRYVIDVMFWVLMMIVFQIIVQFDISTILAPAITVLLMLSFAFGPLFGNLFLATAFVVFMLPFDIGDRVVIGNAGPTQIICYIRSIGLMYTTVETIYKDKMRIPNHTLFHEKIVNCAESTGVAYELQIHFSYYGPSKSTQATIDKFVEMFRVYILEECKLEWQSFFPVISGLDVGANKLQYSFWITHRCNLQQIVRVLTARTAAYKKMRELGEELGLTFAAAMQPVSMLAGGAAQGMLTSRSPEFDTPASSQGVTKNPTPSASSAGSGSGGVVGAAVAWATAEPPAKGT